MALNESDIQPGLVLHLDPDALESQGGTYTCDSSARVFGGHFFLCLAAGTARSVWLPLYSNSGMGRTGLTTNGRIGHPKWTKGTFYWHRDQIWKVPNAAVVAAAAAGGDMSQPGNRNSLDASLLPVSGA